MNGAKSRNNVIDLSREKAVRQGERIKQAPPRHLPRVIAITSGKGGVGKTNIVANLGIALSQLGQKVMILDADLGLGNLDILLGLAPKYNFSHVIKGEKSVAEVLMEGPHGIKILPASSGIIEMTQLTRDNKAEIFQQLDRVVASIDILLIDTAAGISSNVMYFNTAAQEILVVVSPEPTAITDAYALMKVLSLKYDTHRFRLLVNMAAGEAEAQDVHRQLTMVSNRFLNIDIDYLGFVPYDRNVVRGVKYQKAVRELFPHSPAGKSFTSLAKSVAQHSVSAYSGQNRGLFRSSLNGHSGD